MNICVSAGISWHHAKFWHSPFKFYWTFNSPLILSFHNKDINNKDIVRFSNHLKLQQPGGKRVELLDHTQIHTHINYFQEKKTLHIQTLLDVLDNKGAFSSLQLISFARTMFDINLMAHNHHQSYAMCS